MKATNKGTANKKLYMTNPIDQEQFISYKSKIEKIRDVVCSILKLIEIEYRQKLIDR